MKILLIEDRGSVAYYIEDALGHRGHTVVSAASIGEATAAWQQGDVDCIIVDLNLNPEGLTDEEAAQTEDGTLTGWVWLRSRVFSEHPDMAHQTIIYSEYLTALTSAVAREMLHGMYLVPKGRAISSAATLLSCVDAIGLKVRGPRGLSA